MKRSQMLVVAAGVLVMVAAVGNLISDWFWWALMPAAGLLAVGLLRALPLLSPWRLRVAGLALAATALVMLLGAIAGLVTVSRMGVEPDWIGWLTTWTSTALITAAATLGLAIMRQRRRSRLTGVLLAIALPLGLGIDGGLDMIFPPGLPDVFLLGTGVYVGLVLFGIALIRLSRVLPAFADGFAEAIGE